MSRRTVGLAVAAATLVSLAGPASAQTTDEGFINQWLAFPPITRVIGGNSPGIDLLRVDYIADGDETFEATMLPTEDTEVEPDFFDPDSPSVGLADPAAESIFTVWDNAEIDPQLDTMDIAARFGESPDSVFYGIVYINVEGDQPIEGFVELGSDDSVQVKIDDCEAFVRNIARGCGGAGVVQDRAAVTLAPGPHRVMIKVFQGGGGFCYRLRLTDAEGVSLTVDERISVGIDPDDFGLESLDPVGLSLQRTVTPDVLPRISQDNVVDVSVAFEKTLPTLADDVEVVVEEVLADGLTITSATPDPTSNADGIARWNTTVGALVADGISYTIEITEKGEYDLVGRVTVGTAPACGTGSGTILALDLQGILLGDLVGGGEGLGDSDPPPFAAINIDTGLFMTQDEVNGSDGNTSDNDGINPAPVDESDVIDSVFFIDDENTDIQIINSGGVEYQFIEGDAHPVSWNGILSNVTHDRDKGVGNIFVGGEGGIATGVGVHASAGVTFDLAGMRDAYPGQIGVVTGIVGMDTCGGSVNNYIIFSNDDEVLEEPLFIQSATSNTGEFVALIIPEEATYMTFAAGDAGNGIGCDHGVFGDMRVLSVEDAVLPPGNAACARDDDGNLALTWEHIGSKLGEFRITANGEQVGTAAGDALSATVPSASLPDGVVEVCVENSEGAACCATVGGTSVNINCGGPALNGFVDGRNWGSDTNTNPSPFLVAGGNTADFSNGFSPPIGVADTQLTEPEFVDDPERSRLFATERWADGDVVYNFPVANGDYEVFLLFAEGCCSDGCEDLDDPAESLGNCRVFDILINGDVVEDQFSQHVEAQRELGEDLPNANWGIALVKGPYLVEDSSEIEVRIQDLGGGNPPENASIKGISIRAAGVGGAQIRYGDVNNDGAVNIADAIYKLNNLFGDGPVPTCAETADVNSDEAYNIADAIFLLNNLFGDGPPPIDGFGPQGFDCGEDPDPANALGCALYDKC